MVYDDLGVQKKFELSERIQAVKLEAGRADLSEVFRLAYVSEASPLFKSGDLKEIGEKSMLRNAELDITGILVMDEGRILQILEGDEKVVRALFLKISADPRHRSVRQVAGSGQELRYLSCWSLVCGDDSMAPTALKEDFLNLHARLSVREGLGDILPQEMDLLKVISLFRAIPGL